MDNFHDVGSFHARFGLPVSDGDAHHIDPRVTLFRLRFLIEELAEYATAVGFPFLAGVLSHAAAEAHVEHEKVDLPETADALVDLVYIALGTAHYHGIPWQAVWDEVQRANMTKVRATDETASKRRSTLDVVKPVGWVPPDVAGVLKRERNAVNPLGGADLKKYVRGGR